MGQKVHPRSLRVPLIDDWDSNWYVKDMKTFASYVKEDSKIRAFIKLRYKHAGLSKIKIDRKSEKLIVRLHTGKTGMLVGRGGQGLEKIRTELTELTGNKNIQLDVLEVAKVDIDSQLVAESIAAQLEKRIAYRRAMRQVIQRAQRAGIQGIKIMVSGRLGGAEIARTEWTKEGRVPLHTFRADIDYGFAEAKTVFGMIGVKVWIFKGEVMPNQRADQNVKFRSPDGNSPNTIPSGEQHRRSDRRGDRPSSADRSQRRSTGGSNSSAASRS
jgi:small subunit ribosomal protein S3